MDKKPAYEIDGFRLEFCAVSKLRMTRTAQNSAVGLGISLEDVVQIIQSMRRSHFYKSMTATGNHRVWQDVYHVPWQGLTLYVKLTVDELGRFIVSLKEK